MSWSYSESVWQIINYSLTESALNAAVNALELAMGYKHEPWSRTLKFLQTFILMSSLVHSLHWANKKVQIKAQSPLQSVWDRWGMWNSALDSSYHDTSDRFVRRCHRQEESLPMLKPHMFWTRVKIFNFIYYSINHPLLCRMKGHASSLLYLYSQKNP